MDDMDFYDNDGDAEFMIEVKPLSRRRMIVIKVLDGGDIHAEDDSGQMVIVREDGTVSSFLDGDDNWVHGQLSPNPHNGAFWEGSAWDVVGYMMNMTNSSIMERARNGGQPH